MRRIVWVLAAAVLALAGCGGAADEGSSDCERRRRRPEGGPGLRRQDDQARRLDAAVRAGGRDRQPADRGQRGLLRLRQRRRAGSPASTRSSSSSRTRSTRPTRRSSSTTRSRATSRCSRRCSAPRRRSPCCRSSSSDGMLAAPASLDAFWVREENLLPVGAPYQIQAINALDYYVNEADGKGKNVCSFIQDDAYGEAGQAGVDFAAEELGFKVVDTQKFKAGDKDVTGQVQRLQRSKCDAVFLVATPTDAGTIWGTAAKLGFAPRWIGQSPSWIDELGASPLAAVPAEDDVDRRRGHGVGRRQRRGHEADGRAGRRSTSPTRSRTTTSRSATTRPRRSTAVLEKAVELGDLSHEGIMKASEEVGTVQLRRPRRATTSTARPRRATRRATPPSSRWIPTSRSGSASSSTTSSPRPPRSTSSRRPTCRHSGAGLRQLADRHLGGGPQLGDRERPGVEPLRELLVVGDRDRVAHPGAAEALELTGGQLRRDHAVEHERDAGRRRSGGARSGCAARPRREWRR